MSTRSTSRTHAHRSGRQPNAEATPPLAATPAGLEALEPRLFLDVALAANLSHFAYQDDTGRAIDYDFSAGDQNGSAIVLPDAALIRPVGEDATTYNLDTSGTPLNQTLGASSDALELTADASATDAWGHTALVIGGPYADATANWELSAAFSGFQFNPQPFAWFSFGVGASGDGPTVLAPHVVASWFTGSLDGNNYANALVFSAEVFDASTGTAWQSPQTIVTDQDPASAAVELKLDVQAGNHLTAAYRLNQGDWQPVADHTLGSGAMLTPTALAPEAMLRMSNRAVAGPANLVIAPGGPLWIVAAPGATVSVPVTMFNVGGQDAAAPNGIPLSLYLSSTMPVTTSSTKLDTDTQATDLAVQTGYQHVFTFTAPTATGSYNLAALADDGNAVDEANENDNWGQAIRLQVSQLRNSDLTGTWALVNEDGTGTLTFDGQGGITAGTFTQAASGATMNITGGSYALAKNGVLTATMDTDSPDDPVIQVVGSLNAGKDVIVSANAQRQPAGPDDPTSQHDASLSVLLNHTGTFSNADLSGAWVMSGLYDGGVITLNGAGGITGGTLHNETGGAVTVTGGTYSVSASGAVTAHILLTDPSDPTKTSVDVSGYLNNGKDVLVFKDSHPDPTSTDPELNVFVKRAANATLANLAGVWSLGGPYVTGQIEFDSAGHVLRGYVVDAGGMRSGFTGGTATVQAGGQIALSLITNDGKETQTINLTGALGTNKTVGAFTFPGAPPQDQPFASGTVLAVLQTNGAAQIDITLDATDLTSGSTTAINFGTVNAGGTPATKTFTVHNLGGLSLSLGALTVPTGYTVVQGLPATLGPKDSASFTVRLDAGTAGAKAGSISLVNGDTTKTPFTIAITGTVNAVPAVATLTASPNPIIAPNTAVTLTATPTDSDGTVAAVEFYVDVDGDGQLGAQDLLLGTDTSATGGWTWTGTDVHLNTPGTYKFLARAQDNRGAWGAATGASLRVNAPPTIASVSANPTTVLRKGNITITASQVTDDGSVAKVEFYRDANDNGTLEPAADTLLGTGTKGATSSNWTWTGASTGFDTGSNTLLARAQDNNGGWSDAASTTVSVTNNVPTVGTLTLSPAVLTKTGDPFTLSLSTAADSDGTIAAVQFYVDDGDGAFDPQKDNALGAGTKGATGAWTLSAAATDAAPGAYKFFARAQDNDGDWSAPASTTGRVNAPPTIGTLTANPAQVLRRGSLSLTAGAVQDSDGTVSKVEFYRDANHNGSFDAGVDTLLGVGAKGTNSSWAWTGTSTTFDFGANFVFARAQDSTGAWSDAVSATVTVQDNPPVVTGLTATPTVIATPGDNLTLTVAAVTDADGTAAKVEFYLASGDGAFDPIGDRLLGTGTKTAAGTWGWTGSTTDLAPGAYKVFARAQDNDGVWSATPVSTTLRINQAPTIDALAAVTPTVLRNANLTLSASNVLDADGTIAKVEFLRDLDQDGVLDVTDKLLGLGVKGTGANANTWTYTGATTGFSAGTNTFLARATDNNGRTSDLAVTTAQITNNAPTVAAFTVAPTVLSAGGSVTFTLGSAVDSDGTIAKVEFYRDAGDSGFDPQADVLLGTASKSAIGTWTWTGTLPALDPGAYHFYAVATDNDGGVTASSALSARVNAVPTIGSLGPTAGTVLRKANVTLAASNVLDADGTIAKVEFFRDVDQDGELDVTDKLLGVGVKGTGANANTWTYTGSTTGFSAGTNTLLARATDNNGGVSDLAVTTVQISNNAPTVTAFTVAPTVLSAGASATFNLGSAVDNDGTIAKVEFYRDTGDSSFDPQADVLLGTATKSATGTWVWTGTLPGWDAGTYRFFAVATDNDGGVTASSALSARVNAAPTIDSLAPTIPTVLRKANLTLTASNVLDSDGTIAKVEFFRDLDQDGELDATDKLLGVGVKGTGANANTWTYTGATTGFTAGTNTFLARATDNNGGVSDLAVTTVQITNNAPTVTAFTVAPTVLNAGSSATFTLGSAVDGDGTIAKVEFYTDTGEGSFDPQADQLLGTATKAATGSWAWTGVVPAFDAGAYKFFAVATDNDGGVTASSALSARVNAVPTIASLDPTAGTVLRKANLTLAASSVLDTDGTIAKVEFFRDLDQDGELDATDKLLGVGVKGTGASANTWSYTGSTATFGAGTNTFLARATDNNGGVSDLAVTTVQITNNAPTATGLTIVPTTLAQGANLTARIGLARDVDGTVTQAQFWLDDGNGQFDATHDTLLGTDLTAADGWFWTGATSGWGTGVKTVFARILDSDGDWSTPISATVTLTA